VEEEDGGEGLAAGRVAEEVVVCLAVDLRGEALDAGVVGPELVGGNGGGLGLGARLGGMWGMAAGFESSNLTMVDQVSNWLGYT